MKTFKVTYITPDNRRISRRVKYGEFPYLDTIVELPDAQGNIEKCKVTGTSTWQTKFLFWRIEHVEIYVNNAPMSWKL